MYRVLAAMYRQQTIPKASKMGGAYYNWDMLINGCPTHKIENNWLAWRSSMKTWIILRAQGGKKSHTKIWNPDMFHGHLRNQHLNYILGTENPNLKFNTKWSGFP